MASEAAANAVRRVMSTLKVPNPHDKVYKNECAYTFDSPESDGGLYLNVATRTAVCERFLSHERRKTGGVFYIRQVWKRVPKEEPFVNAPDVAPSKLAIGVPGGFATDTPSFEIAKSNELVVFLGSSEDLSAKAVFPFPSQEAENALPTFACTVASALLEHSDNAVMESAATWNAADQVMTSKYADSLQQLPAEGRKISPNPSDWVCSVSGCGKRENLWLNLGTGFIGCGRKNWDGTGGNGHALEHFKETGGTFPLCVKLGTITAAGGDCYSYAGDEDDAVEDPHLARHLAHWGINIMALSKTEKSMAELEIDLNANYDFSRISESGRDLVAVSGPAKIGCENLGNTCYINSSIQVLATIPELAGTPGASGPAGGFGDASLHAALFDSTGASSLPDDLLCQSSKLFTGLCAGTYAASDVTLQATVGSSTGGAAAAKAVEESTANANAVALASAGVTSADASSLTHTHANSVNGQDQGTASKGKPIPPGPGARSGYIVPRSYRSLVGRGHPDFSTSRQQDAPQFLEWLLGLYDRAYGSIKAGSSRYAALQAAGVASILPPNPSDLFSFSVESRLACAQSGAVKYSTGSERFLRLRVPLEAAINRAEVDAARAAAEVAAEAEAAAAGAPSASKKPRLTGPGGAPLPRYHVPFNACLRVMATPGTVEDWMSPATGQKGVAVTTNKLATLPRYLMVVLSRYELAPDWTTRKIDAEVPVPLEFDLSAVQPAPLPATVSPAQASVWDPSPGQTISLLAPRPGGLQPGEVALPAASVTSASSAAAAPAPAAIEPDAELMVLLESMGFPAGACARAAVAVKNAGAEAAMEWLMAHNDDPDFGDPYVPASAAPAAAAPAAASSSGPAVDAGAVSMLCDMGFGPKSATAALKACGGDLERAADWLFSRAGTGELEAIEAGLDQAAAPAPAAGSDMQVDGPAAAAPSASDPEATTAKGQYVLLGFLSHMGSSPASGHYVAHVRRDAQGRSPAHAGVDQSSLKWHIYNDAKVALSEDPPLEQGYVYLFARRG